MFSIRPKHPNRKLAFVVILLLFAGCALSSGDGTYFGKNKPMDGQVLRFVTGSEPKTLDPHQITGLAEARIATALFDGLVEFDEITMTFRASLAKSWTSNKDFTVWTFHLRDDAKWSDNTPLNAHDFIYSWQRAVSPKLASANADSMHMVKNAKPYNYKEAFVRDPISGKYATVSDLKRASDEQRIIFTGAEPERFDSVVPPRQVTSESPASETSPGKFDEVNPTNTKLEKYLFVPSDQVERDKKLKGNTTLAQFVQGKEFIPVQAEHIGLRALDDYTFQVTLEEPSAYFIKRLSGQLFRPVPRKAIEKYGNELWIKPNNIISSGAFKLEEWRAYEKIVVVRNPLFWDNANTRLDKIIFPTVDKTTAMNLYKSGEVDAMGSNIVPPPWTKTLKETKKDYMSGPQLKVEVVAIKTTVPPLDNLLVRKALSMAINRQIIADQEIGRTPSTSLIPKMDGYENAIADGYNPEKARQLLAEAGFPGGKGFPELEILLIDSVKQTFELIQQMWSTELKINVKLTRKEFIAYLDDIRADKLNFNGFARWGAVPDYIDPYAFLELMRSANPGNPTGWNYPIYDDMLDTANREIDPQSRMKLLHAAEQYMLDQQPMIPLFVAASSFMKKPYVVNLVPNLLDQHNWRQVYIDHSIPMD